MESFHVQTTQMKCHGKFHKNQEEVKLTLGDGRGSWREGEVKGTAHACEGREGRHHSSDGQERSAPALGSSEARDAQVHYTRFSKVFKKQDSLCKMNEGGGFTTSERSPQRSSASLLNPTEVPPEPARQHPLVPSQPWSSQDAGPRGGGSDEEPLAAGLQSQQSRGVQGV